MKSSSLKITVRSEIHGTLPCAWGREVPTDVFRTPAGPPITYEEEDQILRELFEPTLLSGMKITSSHGDETPSGWVYHVDPVSIEAQITSYDLSTYFVDLRHVVRMLACDGLWVPVIRKALILNLTPAMDVAYLLMRAGGLPRAIARVIIDYVLAGKVMKVSHRHNLDYRDGARNLDIRARIHTWHPPKENNV